MRVVVADTGPQQYLILVDHIATLPRLFQSVTIPAAVQTEMLHPAAPHSVLTWAAAPPAWVRIVPDAPGADALNTKLGSGERNAIAVALALRADLLLMDDRAGVAAALANGLNPIGTLGVLDFAARTGLIDLETAFERLKATNFRRPSAILEAMLAAWRGVAGHRNALVGQFGGLMHTLSGLGRC